MKFLWEWADSRVYKSFCWNWVYKVYHNLGKEDILYYHQVQNTFSERLKQNRQILPWISLPKTRGVVGTHLEILNHTHSSIHLWNEIYPHFWEKYTSKVPYIRWKSLDNLDRDDLDICFDTSDKIRDYLVGIIRFPQFIDINPCNIKMQNRKWKIHLIITDIAAEINALLEN